MPKKKLKITIKTKEELLEEEVMGLIQNNKIIYHEQKDTKVEYNLTHHQLKRSNQEMEMNYTFHPSKPTQGLIKIKDLQKEWSVPIQTTKLVEEEGRISIEYEVENHFVKYQIEVIK